MSVVTSQTLPLIVPPQSLSLRHSMQAWGDTVVSQTGVGAEQSAFEPH